LIVQIKGRSYSGEYRQAEAWLGLVSQTTCIIVLSAVIVAQVPCKHLNGLTISGGGSFVMLMLIDAELPTFSACAKELAKLAINKPTTIRANLLFIIRSPKLQAI